MYNIFNVLEIYIDDEYFYSCGYSKHIECGEVYIEDEMDEHVRKFHSDGLSRAEIKYKIIEHYDVLNLPEIFIQRVCFKMRMEIYRFYRARNLFRARAGQRIIPNHRRLRIRNMTLTYEEQRREDQQIENEIRAIQQNQIRGYPSVWEAREAQLEIKKNNDSESNNDEEEDGSDSNNSEIKYSESEIERLAEEDMEEIEYDSDNEYKKKNECKNINPEVEIYIVEPFDCIICFLSKTNSVKCGKCNNTICHDCYKELKQIICPFCREYYIIV